MITGKNVILILQRTGDGLKKVFDTYSFMQYAEIETTQRKGLVTLEPTNFGKSYKKLDGQTDTSGWEEWILYSSNNFDNEFAIADEERHAQRGWLGVNFRDRIKEDGRGVDDKGRLGITYISHSGLQCEETHVGIWLQNLVL